MPSSQTSFDTAMPCGDGQTLPGRRIPGARAYIPSSEPAKPVSARPATRRGTTA